MDKIVSIWVFNQSYITAQIIKEKMYIYKLSLNSFNINISPPIDILKQKEEKRINVFSHLKSGSFH